MTIYTIYSTCSCACTVIQGTCTRYKVNREDKWKQSRQPANSKKKAELPRVGFKPTMYIGCTLYMKIVLVCTALVIKLVIEE